MTSGTPNTGFACPLCTARRNQWWHQRKQRDYWWCAECSLVFVRAEQQLSCADEKAIYELHQNGVDDPGYRQFLSGPFKAVTDRLPAGARGLDFGCGPGPALATMLEGAGYPVALYDVYYCPDNRTLQRQYDFICLTEVIEHLSRPGVILAELWGILRDSGWLVVQTQRVRNRDAFINWRYPDDPTHIAFYSEATFAWLASHLGARHWELASRDVVVFQK